MSIIESYIINSTQDDDIFRMKIDDIRPHSHQNLRRGLAADSAAEKVVFGEKVRILPGPAFSDGIAEQHGFRLDGHRGVSLRIGSESCPVCVLSTQWQSREYDRD